MQIRKNRRDVVKRDYSVPTRIVYFEQAAGESSLKHADGPARRELQ